MQRRYPKITGAFLGSTSVELLAAAAREMQQAVPEELKLSPNADPDLFADPNFSVYEENGFLHLPWYAAALACRAAAAKLGRFPGSHPKPSAAAATAATGEAAAAATGGAAAARSVEEAIKQQQELVEKDSAAVLLELEEMEKAVGCRLFAAAKVVQQLVSYRGSEFPATAALVGAVAAQEAIKLLNKKFEPINNTFLWNGVQRRGLTMQL